LIKKKNVSRFKQYTVRYLWLIALDNQYVLCVQINKFKEWWAYYFVGTVHIVIRFDY